MFSKFDIRNLSKKNLAILAGVSVALILVVTFIGSNGTKKSNVTPQATTTTQNNTDTKSIFIETPTNTNSNNSNSTNGSSTPKTPRQIAEDDYSKKRAQDILDQKKADDIAAQMIIDAQKIEEAKITALKEELRRAREEQARLEAQGGQ
jgi:hypothetical protein